MFAGLTALALFAVAVGAVASGLPGLDMLTGLDCGLSICIGSGIEMELATASMPLLIVFVAEGASRGRLISVFWPSSAPNAAAAGLLLCFLESWRSLSCRIRRSSASAAAPVSGAGENLGDKAAISLGDLGVGDALSPALAIDVRFGNLGDCSEVLGGADLRKIWFSVSEIDTTLGR